MHKKLWGVLLIGLFHLPLSCHFDVPGCGTFPTSSRFHTLTTEIVSIDQGMARPWNLQTVAIWNRLGIRIQPDSIEHLTFSTGFNFSLSTDAWACDPALPEFPLIDEFTVIADSAFSMNGKRINPGDTVNHLFWVFGSSATSISEFITFQNERSWIFGYDEDLVLRLIDPPNDTIRSSFHVSIQLEDGVVLDTQTEIFRVRGN